MKGGELMPDYKEQKCPNCNKNMSSCNCTETECNLIRRVTDKSKPNKKTKK